MSWDNFMWGLCVGLGLWTAKLVLDAIQAGVKKLIGSGP